MLDLIKRELIYLWYYSDLQVRQLMPYYIVGTLLGSFIAVFLKSKLSLLLQRAPSLPYVSLLLSAILGFLSPICMFGTLPLAAALFQAGMRQATLACFMMSSVLLNPQLIIYSSALGEAPFYLRLSSSLIMALCAGILIMHCFKKQSFFNFAAFSGTMRNRDTAPNVILRYIFNVGRNLKATLPYFVVGIVLSALLTIHLPPALISDIFGRDDYCGVLIAAALGVPLYMCGGGTIPLLMMALDGGMSLGAATAFMLSGPATKLTNLSALKAVLGWSHFAAYLIFVLVFSTLGGLLINLFLG